MKETNDGKLPARLGLHGCVSILALREEGSRAAFLGSNRICRAWAAACLAELYMAGAVELDGNGRVQARAGGPAASDEASNSVWTAISSSGHPRRIDAWIRKIGEMVSERRMLLPVVCTGLISDERGRYALPEGMRRIEGKSALRGDLRDAVLGEPSRDPGARIIALLAALRRTGCLKLAFTKDERPYARWKIASLIAEGEKAAMFDAELGEGGAGFVAALASGT